MNKTKVEVESNSKSIAPSFSHISRVLPYPRISTSTYYSFRQQH